MKSLPFDGGDFALGTWRFLDGPNPLGATELISLFNASLEAGIDVLDTAEIYGSYGVEAAIGAALAEEPQLKEQLLIVTKAGIDIPSEEKGHARLPHYNATSTNLVTCAEKSLKLLGVETLDLFLVHRPDWLTHPEDTAAGLKQLLDQGKAKAIGVSNYTIHQFETLNQLLGGKLATNQVEFSPLHMDPLYDGVFDQCLQAPIRPMAWSPLAQGRVFDPNDEAATRLRLCLDELKDKYDGAGYDTLIYAWILSAPTRPTVILGTCKESRIPDAAKASEIQLERQDWYAIWQAAKGHGVP